MDDAPIQLIEGEARSDGAFINMLTGLGVSGKDKTLGTHIRSSALIDGWTCDQLYLNGIPRRFIDAIADECYKKPASIELGQEIPDGWKSFIPEFDEYLKGLKFNYRLAECIRLQRLYGAAVLVLLVDDGLSADQPVDPKNIRSIRDFVPLSRYDIIPEQFNMIDPSRPEYYRITTAQKLEPGQTVPFTYFKIHRTRVVRFDGMYLPWSLRSGNQGWGMSCMQLIYEAYRRYETALDGLESMTSDFDLFVHKIPNLFNRVAAGGENDLKKRMEANSLSRSVYNGMLVDKEEEVEFINRNVSGLSNLTAPFLEEIQTVTGWPASYLTGVSPGGLGKEGRYEERVWAAVVENWQQNYLRQGVTELFTMCMLAKDCPSRGQIPDSWSVKFPSIFTETHDEQADLRLKICQSDAQYIQLGVLAPSEVRDSRFGTTRFSIDTTLNQDVSKQLDETAKLNFETQKANLEAQQEAAKFSPDPPGEIDWGSYGVDPNASSEVPPEEGSVNPEEQAKTDSLDFAEAAGLRIKVSHRLNNVCAGHPVAPDGQRMDIDGQCPQVVMGPVRKRATALYRVVWKKDADIVQDGPYVTGFAIRGQASKAVKALYPKQTVQGLKEVAPPEASLLRAAWEQY